LLPAVAPSPALDPEQAQQRLFRTLAQVLIALGTHDSFPAPMVLILEDLHWCDETTLAFLPILMRHIADHSLLLVLTYRSDEVGDDLRHFLALLDRTRQVHEIALGRLDRQGTEAMIGAIFTQRQPIRPDFVDALYALTDGNPFFLEETLKALVASGDIYRVAAGWTRKQMSELRIPRTVADAVQRRVQALSPAAHQLLTLAAVAGQRFDLDLLADVLRLDESALLTQIKELIAAQFVVEQDDDQFAFRHALTRQAIYSQLLNRERRPLHRALVAAIEQRYADKLETRLNDLAMHCFEAGEWAQAMAYAQRAAERAWALFAPHVAIERCSQALEAAARAELPAPPQLYRLRGQMADVVGDIAAAHADYEHALEIARRSNDQQAVWQSLLDLGVLWNARDHARAGTYLQQALDVARKLDNAALAQTLYRLGNWHANMDQQVEALHDQQEALALFERLGDRHGLAMTLDVLGMTSLLVGDMRAAATYQARAITLLRALDDRNALISCLMVYAQRGLSYLGDVSVAATDGLAAYRRDSDEALQLARALGSQPGEAGALGYFALVLGAHGMYDEAIATARQALAIASAIGHPAWQFVGHLALGAVYHDLLDLDLAQQAHECALEQARAVNALEFLSMLASFLAPVYIAQGNFTRAEVLLEEVEASLGTQLTTYVRRRIQAVRAELHLARGEASDALALIDRIIAATPHAASVTSQPAAPGGGVVPRLWRLRGEALTALGRWADAETSLRAAFDAARTLGAQPQAWRVQIALGKLFHSMRKAQASADAFDVARALIAELALQVPDEDRLSGRFSERALAMIPTATLTPLQQARRAAGGLTARERAIATLIAQGKNNREIAETLVISTRTVEVHVSNIMGKLDVSSRAQIAVWAASNGL
jgi:DNA-binding CsgD family transcriptional regulator